MRDPDAVADRFYAEMFERNPHAAELFAGVDMAEQRRKFMHTIDALVRVLDDPFRLVSETVPSGRRHGGYGVTGIDYEVGGVALLEALQSRLGDRFTPEMRAAWRELYTLLASVMQRAGGGAPTAAPTAAR